MTDDPKNELDELVDAAARDYNRPGVTPREEMWQRIRAQRDAARPEVHVVAFTAGRRRWGLGAAAAAVLVLGVALGRGYERLFGDRQESAAVSDVHPVITDSSGLQVADAVPRDSLPPRADVLPEIGAAGRTTAARDRVDRPSSPRTAPSLAAVPDRSAPRENLTYRLAVLQHLAGTEAMLTSFRASAKRGDVDAELTRWARSLLTTTRLLEATAGAQDPSMKRLLGDLELVLLQIAQYTTAGPRSAEELELIEHSIERRGVIGKIRTTIPARSTPAGT